MKIITIDFKNKIIYIATEGEKIVKRNVELDKRDFSNCIPSKYIDYDSFSWNFLNETFAVNQDYKLLDGAEITYDSCLPQFIIPMSGLKKYFKEILKLIGEDETSLKYESTSRLKKFLGCINKSN